MRYGNSTRPVSAAAIALLLLGLTARGARADEGWDLVAGAGGFVTNTYIGADHYYLTPAPVFDVSYTRGGASVELSLLSGASAFYFNERYGFLVGLSANYGDLRDAKEHSVLFARKDHDSGTRSLLSGSPTASSSVIASAMLGTLTPIGGVGLSVAYHPTRVDYPQAGGRDTSHNGFLYGVVYLMEAQLTERLHAGAILRAELMDQEFADGWYTVEQATGELEEFDAKPGFRDLKLTLQARYMLSAHFGLGLLGEGTLLLGDAYESPYTVQRFYSLLAAWAFYSL